VSSNELENPVSPRSETFERAGGLDEHRGQRRRLVGVGELAVVEHQGDVAGTDSRPWTHFGLRNPRLNRRAGLNANALYLTAASRTPAKMPTAGLTTVVLAPMRVIDAAHAFTSKLSTLFTGLPGPCQDFGGRILELWRRTNRTYASSVALPPKLSRAQQVATYVTTFLPRGELLSMTSPCVAN
jgi:hypothetical protein